LGRDEGRLLGLDKGFEIGYEMGVYLGCISLLRDAPPDALKHPKIARHIDALYQHMTTTDPVVTMDPKKEELQEYVNEIRSKFKVIMALLDDDTKKRLVQGTGIVYDSTPVDHAW
jgi:hypothetical protein